MYCTVLYVLCCTVLYPELPYALCPETGTETETEVDGDGSYRYGDNDKCDSTTYLSYLTLPYYDDVGGLGFGVWDAWGKGGGRGMCFEEGGR